MKTKAPVDTDKYIAFNNHIPAYFLSFVIGFFVAGFGLWAEETFFTVAGVLCALVFAILLLISPYNYIFSNENVIICHPFKRKEIIPWEDIRSIDKYGSWFNRGFRSLPHYKIYYRHEKERLFLNGEICRSRKTKRLLKKYYKGTVE